MPEIIQLSWHDGMIGVMAVFRRKKDAEAAVKELGGKYRIMEVSVRLNGQTGT